MLKIPERRARELVATRVAKSLDSGHDRKMKEWLAYALTAFVYDQCVWMISHRSPERRYTSVQFQRYASEWTAPVG